MKKFFAGILTALIFSLSLSGVCLAQTIEGPGGDIELEFPEDFYTMYIDDDESNELTGHLDVTYDTIKSYMDEHDIYADGVNDDGSIELYLIIGGLGRDYGSMSDYPEDTMNDFLENYKKGLEEKGCTNITTEILDDNYYMATYDMENDDTTYRIISYNTFSGEYIYTLNAQYANNDDRADAIAYLDEAKATLKIPQAAKRSGFINPANWKIQWIIIGLLAAVAIAAVVVMAATRKKK